MSEKHRKERQAEQEEEEAAEDSDEDDDFSGGEDEEDVAEEYDSDATSDEDGPPPDPPPPTPPPSSDSSQLPSTCSSVPDEVSGALQHACRLRLVSHAARGCARPASANHFLFFSRLGSVPAAALNAMREPWLTLSRR